MCRGQSVVMSKLLQGLKMFDVSDISLNLSGVFPLTKKEEQSV